MISIFKSFECTCDYDFDEILKCFEQFLVDVQRVCGAIEFKDLDHYYDTWIEDDRIDYGTFPRDGYRRELYKFDMTLGVFANVDSDEMEKNIKMLDSVANDDRSINLVTLFFRLPEVTPKVAALKNRLAMLRPNRFAEVNSLGGLKLNFLLQMSGLNPFNSGRLSTVGGMVCYEGIPVDLVSNIPFLEGYKSCANEVLDALWFAMELTHRCYPQDYFSQIPTLIKANEFDKIAQLLDYDAIHATIKNQVKIYTADPNSYDYDRTEVLVALDKLKLYALNARIIDPESPESMLMQRRYYKERYETTVQCKFPLQIRIKALFDYLRLLKGEKLIVNLLEQCVADHRKILDEGRPKSEWSLDSHGQLVNELDYTYKCTSNDSYKEGIALNFLQDEIIAHYEKAQDLDRVEQLCISEITQHRCKGDTMGRNARLMRLYAKLGAIYESKVTGKDCVLNHQ